MDIDASARTHGVPDDDMLHAIRHHWRAFETDDPDVTMFIGPSRSAAPLEVGVVNDDEGCRGDTRDASSGEVPNRMVDTMTTSRAERAAALERWAEAAEPDDLRQADTDALREIAELTERRDEVDAEIVEAIRAARAAHRSWSEIGSMLGVSKQAAQRKYSKVVST